MNVRVREFYEVAWLELAQSSFRNRNMALSPRSTDSYFTERLFRFTDYIAHCKMFWCSEKAVLYPHLPGSNKILN
jgi:hypothetical protein